MRSSLRFGIAGHEVEAIRIPFDPRSGCAVAAAACLPADRRQRRRRAPRRDRHAMPSVTPSAQGPMAHRALPVDRRSMRRVSVAADIRSSGVRRGRGSVCHLATSVRSSRSLERSAVEPLSPPSRRVVGHGRRGVDRARGPTPRFDEDRGRQHPGSVRARGCRAAWQDGSSTSLREHGHHAELVNLPYRWHPAAEAPRACARGALDADQPTWIE